MARKNEWDYKHPRYSWQIAAGVPPILIGQLLSNVPPGDTVCWLISAGMFLISIMVFGLISDCNLAVEKSIKVKTANRAAASKKTITR